MPSGWGVTAGDKLLKQHADITTDTEMNEVFEKAKNVENRPAANV